MIEIESGKGAHCCRHIIGDINESATLSYAPIVSMPQLRRRAIDVLSENGKKGRN